MYDEAALAARLAPLDRQAKTAFAAACAQRLLPLFERYARAAGSEAQGRRLQEILSSAWEAASGVTVDVQSLGSEAESMAPPEDEDGGLEADYAENASAAVAYAIRTWLSDDPQEAVWAARQVYEVAEHAFSQTRLEPGKVYVQTASQRAEEAEATLASGLVQSALTAIRDDLEIAESSASSWLELRRRSNAEGRQWAATFP